MPRSYCSFVYHNYQGMKTIKKFLASSEELLEDRYAFQMIGNWKKLRSAMVPRLVLVQSSCVE